MRHIFFVLAVLASFCTTFDTKAADYRNERIKSFVEQTPRNVENRISTLAEYLTKPYNNNYDKAKAIAFWIAGHINYDSYLYNNGRTTKLLNTYMGQSANDLLKSRVGICGDFAELFATLCRAAGIKAVKVHGYAYSTNGYLSTKELQNSGHAWNYFLYKNQKIYVDTTFMAKGRTKLSGRPTNLRHRRALKEIRRDNKYTSQMNDFDDYYFDFSYRQEERERGYKHQEMR